MKYRLHSRFQFGVLSDRVAGVGVAVETGEIAAGDLHPNLMSHFEHIAGGPQVYAVFVDLTGFQQPRR